VPFKDYYDLAKPGLVYGNIVTVVAGFLLGVRVSSASVNGAVLAATIAGIFLVMASGCVFNNYIDRDIDARMARTKDRALVTGRVSGRAALVYGAALGVAGFGILLFYTNLAAAGAALVGFFFYVVMYSLWWKRRSPFGTVVGSVAGAVPPVVGYAAAAGRIDLAAALLFLIMVLWQMPHFYAIGIRRFGDYAAAGVPILPVAKGIPATKTRMLLYIIAFTVAAPLLTAFGYLGAWYAVTALILGAAWLALCLRGFRAAAGAAADALWARRMFFFSLFVMVALFGAIAVGAAFGV